MPLLLGWVDFFFILVWFIVLGLLLSVGNLLNMILLGELMWATLFIGSSLLSVVLDSGLLLSLSFFSLGLATGETVIALSLFILSVSLYGTSSNYININYKNFFLYNNNNINIISSNIN